MFTSVILLLCFAGFSLAAGARCGCPFFSPSGGEDCSLRKDGRRFCIKNQCMERPSSPTPSPTNKGDPPTPQILDGNPACIRGLGSCCGPNLSACTEGKICHNDQCVDACPKVTCGCDSKLECKSGQFCTEISPGKHACTAAPTPPPPPPGMTTQPPFVADGAPQCIRGGGVCCGNGGVCNAGQVCDSGKCLDKCPAADDFQCGCDKKLFCPRGTLCAFDAKLNAHKCQKFAPPPTSAPGEPQIADGTPACLRGGSGICCGGGFGCKAGQICDQDKCVDKCLIAPPTSGGLQCGCDKKLFCKSGTMCQFDGKAHKCGPPPSPPTSAPGEPQIADGTPFCLRGGKGRCCGSGADCKDGEICNQNKCVSVCLAPPTTQPTGILCGCDKKVRCQQGHACVNDVCEAPKTLPPSDPPIADGASICQRGGFCCGSNTDDRCQDKGLICHNNKCIKTAQCPSPPVTVIPKDAVVCGCDKKQKCASGYSCVKNVCKAPQIANPVSDGADICQRGGFCCGNQTKDACRKAGFVCHDDQCIEEAKCPTNVVDPTTADGTTDGTVSNTADVKGTESVVTKTTVAVTEAPSFASTLQFSLATTFVAVVARLF